MVGTKRPLTTNVRSFHRTKTFLPWTKFSIRLEWPRRRPPAEQIVASRSSNVVRKSLFLRPTIGRRWDVSARPKLPASAPRNSPASFSPFLSLGRVRSGVAASPPSGIGRKISVFTCVVNVIKYYWRKSRKSRFPPWVKQMGHFKAITDDETVNYG